MIDLHLHTTKSDGTDSPIEVLRKVEELKLEYISITDHETCEAYNDLKNIDVSKYYSGKIIKGIELKNYYKGRVIDILGYNIDTDYMNNYVQEYFKDKTHAMLQTKYLKKFYEQAKELNLKLTPIDELDWNPDNDWASVVFFFELKKHKENEQKVPEDLWNGTFRHFKHKYSYNKENLFYIDKSGDYPTPDETVKVIHKAGGKAFVAHTFEYTWIENKEEFLKDMLNNAKVDGFECYYSNFTEKQTDAIVNFCNKHNLYMSGGSDCHGENKPGIDIGIGRGNLDINKDILTWINE